MARTTLMVGGGIGGLAGALACARAGMRVDLLERANEFSEVGAGIQLGPNVMTVLHGWGLQEPLAGICAFPQRLQVRSALSGKELGVLRLGAQAQAQYGAPYATIHRADLHALLLATVREQSAVQLKLGTTVDRFEQRADGVTAGTTDGLEVSADLLVGADGLWSRVRQQLLNDEPPRATGHLAYRALVQQSGLPEPLRSSQVTVWLGPQLHVVQYPVRGGEWLNVVAIVHGRVHGDVEYWDHSANADKLRRAMAATCAPLQNLICTIEQWRLWALSIRAPMGAAREQAQGRVALLGDAAHPMLPYLAQGAGMAIEDAQCLGLALADTNRDISAALQHYAAQRWQRNARVQAGAIRNGRVFHASGLVRWGRDASMKLLGESLLDMPWLYRGPP